MRSEHHDTIFRHEMEHWWYRVRRELVHDLICRYRPRGDNLRIADIGAGGGALTKEMERYGTSVGIDASEQSIAFCKGRGVRDVRLGTAEATGLESESFDMVTCLDVLEHLKDDASGIVEISRVLKKDGVGIIFVPAFMFLWGKNDEDSEHYRRYRLPELEQKFLSSGFTILRQTYFNTLLFPPIALLRISQRLLKGGGIDDVDRGNGVVNALLYRIFSLERSLLRSVNFPFGVSAMLVVKKGA